MIQHSCLNIIDNLVITQVVPTHRSQLLLMISLQKTHIESKNICPAPVMDLTTLESYSRLLMEKGTAPSAISLKTRGGTVVWNKLDAVRQTLIIYIAVDVNQ